jgi:hypothetical protein
MTLTFGNRALGVLMFARPEIWLAGVPVKQRWLRPY